MRILLIVFSTALAYFVLYSPQPLLPLYSQIFQVSESKAALLTTATLLPLSIAPLSYGFLLESFSPVKLLRGSILFLAVLGLGFALADSFGLLVTIRFCQGLLLPAVLTSVMTYISATVEGSNLRRVMSLYVTSTILGGFLGRVLAGFAATYFHWRFFFFGLAAALLLCFLALHRLPDSGARISKERTRVTAVFTTFCSGRNAGVLLSVFCLFFVFAGLLNFIPFRLAELHDQPSELFTGLMYSGYLMGALASLSAGRITTRLGGESNAMIVGFCFYGIALGLTMVSSQWVLFTALFAFCGSMFFVHTIAATLVNQGARNRGIVNGLYVTFYYGGGALGSFAPGLVYERFGWNAFILLLLGVVGAGLAIALTCRFAEKLRVPFLSICPESGSDRSG